MAQIIKSQLDKLLDNVPQSWLGTTFPNDVRFLGRERFMDVVLKLLCNDVPIKKNDLERMYPTDYARLGTPLSCVLEVIRAKELGFHPHNVLVFGSSTLPLLSVLFTSKTRVYVYGQLPPKVKAHANTLQHFLKVNFTHCSGEPQKHPHGVVVFVGESTNTNPHVDAVVTDNLLFVASPDKIPINDVKDENGDIKRTGMTTYRKRLGGSCPTPDVLALLQGKPLHQEPDTSALKLHLKQMAGLPNAKGSVVLGTTGLSALGALLVAAAKLSNLDLDLVQCSTAYGGSAQQATILSEQIGVGLLTRHTFDIQGKADVFTSLSTTMETMKSGPKKSWTIIQLEYPTNPDMKDTDLEKMEAMMLSYQKATGSRVVLSIDTTFSPISKSAARFSSEVAIIVFNSLSKSVSGGMSTGGSLVANNHDWAQQLLETSHEIISLFDNGAKGCQLQHFSEMHDQTELRIAQAHKNATLAAAHLEKSVLRHSGKLMKINFVTKKQIAKEVIPATMSFNLPPPTGMSKKNLEALAQKFVDELVRVNPKAIKPCVSFGQKNTLVYVTVPATSTQGVISWEDKAKQAVGGVQLVRFSFPPMMDMDAWNLALDSAIRALYRPVAKSKI